ncbi:glycosyltransferase [Actinoplanes sp. NEAU-A12]|uniref:Glycosyltransferase n=1 Tax=Actinoplanes sandaracinus TaxID=3045177 RepID=A0ABT6WNH8_9ACTN|nr:glycosyltransferase [Actinoplanes sandaracinus]MDI6101295.1 glycosyltransferase [Actinoplanes sandaracinus]
MTLRVLATSNVFEPGFRGGGPVRSLALLLDTIPPDIDLTLVTQDRDVNATEPYPGLSGEWVRRGRADVFYLPVHDRRAWLSLWRRLRTTAFDVLYVNSLWSPVFTVVPVLACRMRLVRADHVVVAPRGEFSMGALAQKSWKKRPFAIVWGRLLKNMGATWHASTAREASEIRAVYPWARIRVALDQVALPAEPLPPLVDREQPRFVFMSRIVPKKNLLTAIEALGRLPGQVQLDVFGPMEDAAYWQRCLRVIKETGTTDRVHYRGELPPSAVRQTFQRYDAFIFPTWGENFGHVIAESLSASCPVICSDQTPWSAVLSAGGGAAIQNLSAGKLSAEIGRVMARSPAERLAARHAAGAAYRAWHASHSNENFLSTLTR